MEYLNVRHSAQACRHPIRHSGAGGCYETRREPSWCRSGRDVKEDYRIGNMRCLTSGYCKFPCYPQFLHPCFGGENIQNPLQIVGQYPQRPADVGGIRLGVPRLIAVGLIPLRQILGHALERRRWERRSGVPGSRLPTRKECYFTSNSPTRTTSLLPFSRSVTVCSCCSRVPKRVESFSCSVVAPATICWLWQ
jgi:hypothetical protein